MDTDTPLPEDQYGPAEATRHEIKIPFPQTFIYANCFAFSMSHMDIRIGFAEAMPDAHAEPKVGIVLPPEVASQLAVTLLQQLAVFEAQFGQLRLFSVAKARAAMTEVQTRLEAEALRGDIVPKAASE
jgi:hypothetical protein